MVDVVAPPAPVLDVDRVEVRLGRRHATRILEGVSLRIAEGEIVGLVGETGSGKTTLARTILGLVDPTVGTVRIGGTATSQLRGGARREFRRRGTVQFVFQDPLRSLDPDLRVVDIVTESLAIRGELGAVERRTRAAEVLEQVGLDGALLGTYPAQLSGGQRQRVSIARALAGGPRLLVCDEPVSALDASSRNQVLRLLDTLRRDLGLGILVISHDLSSLASVADRIAVLYRGRILEDGPTADVLESPRHPYTGLLVASAPSVRHDRPLVASQLRWRDGDPDVPAGTDPCVFASRCPFATSACATAPPLTPAGPGRVVACHHADSWFTRARQRPAVPLAPALGGAPDRPQTRAG